MKKITEKQLFNIIQDRLSLQSTQRNLESYRLPKYKNDISYFQSADFISTFKNWDNKKQEKFLQNLAGNYWGVAVQTFNKI